MAALRHALTIGCANRLARRLDRRDGFKEYVGICFLVFLPRGRHGGDAARTDDQLRQLPGAAVGPPQRLHEVF